MIPLEELRRITVYADSALEEQLLEHFVQMGAKGYTVVECRGKGKHAIVEDMFHPMKEVRIEVIVQPEVAERIMEYLGQAYFHNRAVLGALETVRVPVREHL